MIKIKNNYYRNLEEQVQFLTDYHDVNQGLVQWGIRVVGQVETAGDLPVPYEGEYGDAIAVGTEAPFFFYIWTRASIEGDPAYWFPFGEISIVGPQGPKGDKGDRGEVGPSSKWYVGAGAPYNTAGYNDGDMYLADNGQVFRFENGSWRSVTNIKGANGIQGIQGPQGPQGPAGPQGAKGEQGDVGGFINIAGIINDFDEYGNPILPTPSSLNNLTQAYLVGASAPYDLYVQIGSTSATATWKNAGPFNAATLVTSGGIGLNIWNADTKVDKMTGTPDGGATRGFVYGLQSDGTTPNLFKVQIQANADTIPLRNPNGTFYVGTPTIQYEAVNKGYVDSKFAPTSPSETINWTGRNPNATALDSTLTGSIETGAKNTYATVLNKQTTAYNANALAIGNKCIAKGDESLAGGYQSVTLDSSAVAIGEQVVAAANSAVAFGNSTQALANHTLVYGHSTKANQPCALAGGNGSQALNENSVAIGASCITNGAHSVAFGDGSTTGATAYASFAAGLGIKTTDVYQVAFGRYNEGISGNIFEIGNGTGASTSSRRTIFAVTRDGRAKADTLPSDNNDLTNKFYVDNVIKGIFTIDGTTLTITTE